VPARNGLGEYVKIKNQKLKIKMAGHLSYFRPWFDRLTTSGNLASSLRAETCPFVPKRNQPFVLSLSKDERTIPTAEILLNDAPEFFFQLA